MWAAIAAWMILKGQGDMASRIAFRRNGAGVNVGRRTHDLRYFSTYIWERYSRTGTVQWNDIRTVSERYGTVRYGTVR